MKTAARQLKSQSGFSLIELMIVVAIIGILATIAIPNFNRFQAKARQAEAKTSLSAIYVAMKAFQGEWNGYFNDFRDIGYVPEGSRRYQVGWTASCTGGTPQGYTGPSSPTPAAGVAAVQFNTSVAPGTSTYIGVNNPGAALDQTAPANSCAATTFVAAARGDIDQDGNYDRWTVNEIRRFSNTDTDL